MRLLDIAVTGQYFYFRVEDQGPEFNDPESPFGLIFATVIYDNERVTVGCNCRKGTQCEHIVFVHKVIQDQNDANLKTVLIAAREKNAQTITESTINRIRGAFAREYNLAKGIISTPERRGPLGWQGRLRSGRPVRVVQRSPFSFMVYEIGKETWSLVVGIESPQCQNQRCNERRVSCFHEEAVEEAFREWRRGGMMEPARGGEVSNDFQMVMSARQYGRNLEQMQSVIRREILKAFIDPDDRTKYTLPDGAKESPGTSAAPGTESTLSLNIEKLEEFKAMLEPKPKKQTRPPKPRSRFTEIDL